MPGTPPPKGTIPTTKDLMDDAKAIGEGLAEAAAHPERIPKEMEPMPRHTTDVECDCPGGTHEAYCCLVGCGSLEHCCQQHDRVKNPDEREVAR